MKSFFRRLGAAIRPSAPPRRPAGSLGSHDDRARQDSRARALLARMTPAEKIGQLQFAIIFPGSPADLTLTPDLEALVAEDAVGGYFITAAGADASRVRDFTAALQARARFPLLLATDCEGGDWNFVRSAVGPRPANDAVGATGDPQAAYRKGLYDAALLTYIGLNVNFAPVVDLFTNPGTPILQHRTFGATPDVVIPMAAAYIDGLAEGGIAGCLKHWPGLGAANADPHKTLPVVDRTLDQFRAEEFAPYRELLRLGRTPMIMTTHMLVPALDPTLPTSISPTVIDGLLRKELDYDGVVVADSLSMGALSERYTIPEAALLAFEAGSDILLGAPSVEEVHATIALMLSALADGRITHDQLDAAVLRILRFKLSWGIIPADASYPAA